MIFREIAMIHSNTRNCLKVVVNQCNVLTCWQLLHDYGHLSDQDQGHMSCWVHLELQSEAELCRVVILPTHRSNPHFTSSKLLQTVLTVLNGLCCWCLTTNCQLFRRQCVTCSVYLITNNWTLPSATPFLFYSQSHMTRRRAWWEVIKPITCGGKPWCW